MSLRDELEALWAVAPGARRAYLEGLSAGKLRVLAAGLAVQVSLLGRYFRKAELVDRIDARMREGGGW